MARRLCQVLLALALLYAGAVGLYGWLAYDSETRPDVVTIAGAFHGWVAHQLRYEYEPEAAPAVPPAPHAREAAPPAPAPAPAGPPPTPRSPKEEAVHRVRTELLPRAQQLVAEMADRSSPDFEVHRTAAMVTLNQARDLLGHYIDAGQADPEVHKLYKQVMDLLSAVRKK